MLFQAYSLGLWGIVYMYLCRVDLEEIYAGV